MRIGFVGLGTMGGPMARRLAAQGHQVIGYDVDATRAAAATSRQVSGSTVLRSSSVAPAFTVLSTPSASR